MSFSPLTSLLYPLLRAIEGAICFVQKRLLRNHFGLHLLFLGCSSLFALTMHFYASSGKAELEVLQSSYRNWKGRGVTMALPPEPIKQFEQWAATLGPRFKGRFVQDISRDHLLFKEIPYSLSQPVLIQPAELEELLKILGSRQSGRQNGSLFVTKFGLKRQGEETQVQYDFIVRKRT